MTNTLVRHSAKEPNSENLLYFPKDLLAVLDDYSKPALAAGFYSPIRKFLIDNEDFCRSQRVTFRTYDLLKKRSLGKGELVRIAAIPFLTKKLFFAYRATLNEDVRTLLDEMVWTGKMGEDRMRTDFKIDVVKPSNKPWRDKNDYLHGRFYFFGITLRHQSYPTKYYATLSLPSPIRKILIEYYDKPKAYHLHALESVRKASFVFEGESVIGQELTRVLIYCSQGNLKLTPTGKPVASSLKKMKRALNISEFYDDEVPSLSTLRSYLLAILILTRKKRDSVNESLPMLEELFKDYLRKFDTLSKILNDVKGVYYVHELDKNTVEPALWGILKEMPTEKWVSINDILKFITYRMLNISPVTDYGAAKYLFYSVTKRTYTEKQYINDALYEHAVTLSTIKGTFFLFAAFGIVDAAYNTPNISSLGTSYYSAYDGLERVRLTSLGAYLCGGHKGSYQLPSSENSRPISLSPDSLIIIGDEKDQTFNPILQNYAQKIGSNRYKVTYETFMKECRTQADLRSKIDLFKQTLVDDIPPVWTTFFEELLRKCNPFSLVKAHKVFKLPNDRELINLIAQDNVLKSLVIKAEDFHIIVLKTNFPKFKSRLREFGYLIDQ